MKRTIILDPSDMPAPVEALPEPAKDEQVKPIGQPYQPNPVLVQRELDRLRVEIHQMQQRAEQRARDNAAQEEKDLAAMSSYVGTPKSRASAELWSEAQRRAVAAHGEMLVRTGRSVGKSTSPSMPKVTWHDISTTEKNPPAPPLPGKTQAMLEMLERYVPSLTDLYFPDVMQPVFTTLSPVLIELAKEKLHGKTNDNPGGK